MTPDVNAPDADEPAADDVAQARRIQQFWEQSRTRAGMARVGAVVGVGWTETMPPPAWSFGDSPQLADELLRLVLARVKTATAGAVWEYEAADEPLPRKGSLSIVLDGAGEPGALIRTTVVEVVRFEAVTEEHAFLEGEGDRSLEEWRESHETYWRRTLPPTGHEFRPDMDIVCERFELLYPKGR
ncbi:ASCH domain-containing protein [Xylanimonas sp. McL0601]|uniref:ASCH domain-containing protein n=1 Tax=Xylanimonas sp. McL0601 TaxID=3414739 RepID=UPI003CF715D8